MLSWDESGMCGATKSAAPVQVCSDQFLRFRNIGGGPASYSTTLQNPMLMSNATAESPQ